MPSHFQHLATSISALANAVKARSSAMALHGPSATQTKAAHASLMAGFTSQALEVWEGEFARTKLNSATPHAVLADTSHSAWTSALALDAIPDVPKELTARLKTLAANILGNSPEMWWVVSTAWDALEVPLLAMEAISQGLPLLKDSSPSDLVSALHLRASAGAWDDGASSKALEHFVKARDALLVMAKSDSGGSGRKVANASLTAYNHAVALHGEGRWSEAAGWIKAAVALHPGSDLDAARKARALRLVADCLARMGETDAALEALDQAQDTSVTTDAVLAKIRILISAGAPDAARDVARSSLWTQALAPWQSVVDAASLLLPPLTTLWDELSTARGRSAELALAFAGDILLPNYPGEALGWISPWFAAEEMKGHSRLLVEAVDLVWKGLSASQDPAWLALAETQLEGLDGTSAAALGRVKTRFALESGDLETASTAVQGALEAGPDRVDNLLLALSVALKSKRQLRDQEGRTVTTNGELKASEKAPEDSTESQAQTAEGLGDGDSLGDTKATEGSESKAKTTTTTSSSPVSHSSPGSDALGYWQRLAGVLRGPSPSGLPPGVEPWEAAVMAAEESAADEPRSALTRAIYKTVLELEPPPRTRVPITRYLAGCMWEASGGSTSPGELTDLYRTLIPADAVLDKGSEDVEALRQYLWASVVAAKDSVPEERLSAMDRLASLLPSEASLTPSQAVVAGWAALQDFSQVARGGGQADVHQLRCWVPVAGPALLPGLTAALWMAVPDSSTRSLWDDAMVGAVANEATVAGLELALASSTAHNESSNTVRAGTLALIRGSAGSGQALPPSLLTRFTAIAAGGPGGVLPRDSLALYQTTAAAGSRWEPPDLAYVVAMLWNTGVYLSKTGAEPRPWAELALTLAKVQPEVPFRQHVESHIGHLLGTRTS